jgi:hypothetical protein
MTYVYYYWQSLCDHLYYWWSQARDEAWYWTDRFLDDHLMIFKVGLVVTAAFIVAALLYFA